MCPDMKSAQGKSAFKGSNFVTNSDGISKADSSDTGDVNLMKKINSAKNFYDAATAEAKPLYTKCMASKASRKSKQTLCDGEQAVYEQAACQYYNDFGTVCNTYHNCFETAAAAYSLKETEVGTNVLSRKDEFKASAMIMCFVKLLNSPTQAQDKDVKKCSAIGGAPDASTSTVAADGLSYFANGAVDSAKLNMVYQQIDGPTCTKGCRGRYLTFTRFNLVNAQSKSVAGAAWGNGGSCSVPTSIKDNFLGQSIPDATDCSAWTADKYAFALGLAKAKTSCHQCTLNNYAEYSRSDGSTSR